VIHNDSLRLAGIRSKQRSCSSVTQKQKQTVHIMHTRTGALTIVRNAGILQRRTGMLVFASASFKEIQCRCQPANTRTETCSSQCGYFTTPRQWVLEQRGVGRQVGRCSRRRRSVCRGIEQISSLIFAISASCNIKSRRISCGNGAVPSMWQQTHVIIHRKGAGTRFGHGLGTPEKI